MSNAKQILAMLRSRAEGDDAQFYSIALQVAASEARQGHRDTANDLVPQSMPRAARAGSRRLFPYLLLPRAAISKDY